jgi:hypothetical protein
MTWQATLKNLQRRQNREADMEFGRRPVLIGLATTSVALAAPSVAAPAAPLLEPDAAGRKYPSTVAAIVGGSPYDSSFLAGVQAACGAHRDASAVPLRLENVGSATLEFVKEAIPSGQHGIIVGLVDDAAAVIVELARSAGASMLWLGHHSISVDDSPSRHRVLTTATGQGCGVRLGQSLSACEESFELTEQSFASSSARCADVFAVGPGANEGKPSHGWAGPLGFMLIAAHHSQEIRPEDMLKENGRAVSANGIEDHRQPPQIGDAKSPPFLTAL